LRLRLLLPLSLSLLLLLPLPWLHARMQAELQALQTNDKKDIFLARTITLAMVVAGTEVVAYAY